MARGSGTTNVARIPRFASVSGSFFERGSEIIHFKVVLLNVLEFMEYWPELVPYSNIKSESFIRSYAFLDLGFYCLRELRAYRIFLARFIRN